MYGLVSLNKISQTYLNPEIRLADAGDFQPLGHAARVYLKLYKELRFKFTHKLRITL